MVIMSMIMMMWLMWLGENGNATNVEKLSRKLTHSVSARGRFPHLSTWFAFARVEDKEKAKEEQLH